MRHYNTDRMAGLMCVLEQLGLWGQYCSVRPPIVSGAKGPEARALAYRSSRDSITLRPGIRPREFPFPAETAITTPVDSRPADDNSYSDEPCEPYRPKTYPPIVLPLRASENQNFGEATLISQTMLIHDGRVGSEGSEKLRAALTTCQL